MIILSGGDQGGLEVDGTNWDVGNEMTIGNSVYRKITETQAIYVGIA